MLSSSNTFILSTISFNSGMCFALSNESFKSSAIKANPKKVVIKRPLTGEYLAGIKPNYSIKGKAIRYDCII